MFCAVYIYTVSIKSTTVSYGGRLLEKLVNVVQRVLQGIVLGPLLFLLYTLELFYILENNQFGYANDSTLLSVLPSPGFKITVAE